MKKFFVLLSAFFLFSATQAQTTFNRSQDWEAIKAEAKKNQKLIFIDSYTDWCGWCKEMDKNTFSNQGIGGMMNNYFVNYKLEMEKEDLGKQLALKYAITSYPSFLIFNAKGELVYTIVGYQDPATFMTTLLEVLKPLKHENRPGYSLDFIEDVYPDFYLKAMGMKGKKKFPEEKDFNKWMHKNQDLSKEVNFTVFKRFNYLADMKSQQLFWDQRSKLDSLFGYDFIDYLTREMIGKEVIAIAKKKEDAAFEKLLVQRLPLLDKEEEMGKSYRMFYYAETNNWRKIVELLSATYKEKGIEPLSFWNQQCWDIYEKSDDTLLIAKAVDWMSEVCKVNDDYNYLDTYAALLFKAGKLEEAKEMAQVAITKGKAENLKVAGSEELMEKIDAAIEANKHIEKPAE